MTHKKTERLNFTFTVCNFVVKIAGKPRTPVNMDHILDL